MDEEPVQVLLVEDDDVHAQLVADLLAEANGDRFQVVRVDRLLAGRERLAEGGIDVVLLDLGLPDSRGLATLDKMHARSQGVPIIVVTGLAEAELAIQSLQKGAQDYLLKTRLNSSMLTRVIRYSIERYRLLAQLGEKTRKLKASEARFRNVITRNADGIVVVDGKGIARFVNPAAMLLFGRKPEELLGEPFGFPLVAGEATEVEIRRKDGEVRTAEMRVVEIEWQGKSASLASLRDVTEAKRMREELEQAREEELRTKDQFLSHVSHELRSPLSAIHQFITIVLDGIAGYLPPDQGEYLEIALRNVHELRAMVEDLLEVTRAQSGKLIIAPRATSINGRIAETLSTLRPSADIKGVTLTAEYDGDLPHAYADPRRVRQILTNLIENAIKFTLKNGTITVRAHVWNQDPGFLCVAVKDTGCGVPSEEKGKIFDNLYQAKSNIEA
jgi:signal transduction histidine kinase